MPVTPPSNTIARSATQFILSALRLVGALRSGNNLSAAELNDCLQVLNDLVDSWSASRILIYNEPIVNQNQNGVPLSLVANQASYKLGNILGTEDFLLPRPPKLERVSIFYSASQQTPVELPMDVLTDEEWQGIANKSTTSLLPQVCYVTDDFPDRILYFWPVPTQANPVTLYPWAALAQFPNLTTSMQFPTAYARAIRYNLAIDLAAEFPCDLTKIQLVTKIATEAKRIIQNMNSKIHVAWCDPALLGGTYPRGNIYTGSPSRSRNF